MTPFYILGTVSEVEERAQRSKSTQSPIGEIVSSSKKKTFKGAREKQINGTYYLLVPLSEIAEFFELELSDFLEDDMLDIISVISKRRGYNPIIQIRI